MKQPFENLKVQSSRFTPAEIASISGVPVDLQRHWKRRGLYESRGQSVMDAARFLLVRVLANNDVDRAEAWALADDEAVGTIVFKAGQIRGAIEDRSGEQIFAKNPSFRVRAAMELTGMEHCGGGLLFAWGGQLKRPNLFDTWERIRGEFVDEKSPTEPRVVRVLDLSDLPKILAQRAGVLGYVEKLR